MRHNDVTFIITYLVSLLLLVQSQARLDKKILYMQNTKGENDVTFIITYLVSQLLLLLLVQSQARQDMKILYMQNTKGEKGNTLTYNTWLLKRYNGVTLTNNNINT